MIQLLPVLGLTLALAVVFALIRRVDFLEARNERLAEVAFQAHRGMYVPAFDAISLDGQPFRIGNSSRGKRQILFLFATTCPYCKASLPAWKGIAARLRREDAAEVVGAALDSVHLTRAYATTHALNYPVIFFPDRKHESMYRARSVPMMLVLEPDGRVIYARRGIVEAEAVVDSLLSAVYASATAGSTTATAARPVTTR